ncbi:MAG: carotenoid biosynthesis protein [Chloroflexota bacterium]
MKKPAFPPLSLALLFLWTLAMLVQPILLWTWGQAAFRTGMSLTVVIQAVAVLAVLAGAWGWKRTASLLALVAVSAYLAELLGSQTGFPFGKYHYTGVLQPQLAGVPLLIPLAWLMMLPPSWAVARLIAGEQSPLSSFIILSAFAFTAWDLFLDPQMAAWGFWVWESPGQYFGIPLVNYLGWLLVSAIITALARPRDLPLAPLAAVYTITWLLQTIGQGLFWAQPGPAVCGFLGMGAMLAWAWHRTPIRKK